MDMRDETGYHNQKFENTDMRCEERKSELQIDHNNQTTRVYKERAGGSIEISTTR